MKNSDIIAAVQGGFLLSTANTLPASEAYKHGKLRRALKKAYEALVEAQKEMLKDEGVEDYNALLREYAEKKSDEAKVKIERIGELLAKSGEDDTPLEGVVPLSWENWHTLRAENAAKGSDGKQDLIPNAVEDALLDIGWKEPAEEA